MKRTDFYTPEDFALEEMLPKLHFLGDIDPFSLTESQTAQQFPVHLPDEAYGFLHEAAGITYHGVIFAAWYNCPTLELQGETPIRQRRSFDGGRTWTEPEIIAQDLSGKILYCPPVYGIYQDRLYLFLNQMVSADHIHALDLYEYDEPSERFVRLWSQPLPFKLNTNLMTLPNGKLMLSGRIAELDGFPNTPAVLLADDVRGPWRLVKIRENGDLPDGAKLVHPEICPILRDGKLYMFCRDDERRVPLVYVSEDYGEHWTGPYAHDVPLSSSKIYAGTLSDGRHYLMGNLPPDRRVLYCLFTEPGSLTFTHGQVIAGAREGVNAWHYPVAWEDAGRLYAIYTVSMQDWSRRGAMLSIL